MKLLVTMLLLGICLLAKAESDCDLRLGRSVGVAVLEFSSDNRIHSKMTLQESSIRAINEEFLNLQDEGICSSKAQQKKCILRFEKKPELSIMLIRGSEKWHSWQVSKKTEAQDFVKNLRKLGFCS